MSGAVFPFPVQLSVLHVPSPAVTPTNLLFNVVSGPGAVLRYRDNGQPTGRLARVLIAGAVPGVIIGAGPETRPGRRAGEEWQETFAALHESLRC